MEEAEWTGFFMGFDFANLMGVFNDSKAGKVCVWYSEQERSDLVPTSLSANELYRRIRGELRGSGYFDISDSLVFLITGNEIRVTVAPEVPQIDFRIKGFGKPFCWSPDSEEQMYDKLQELQRFVFSNKMTLILETHL